MSENELNKIIAKNISEQLEKHNKTQLDLAEYMDVSQATVSNWCKGIKMPRMSKIDMICEFFSIQRSDLLNAAPDHPAPLLDGSKDKYKVLIECYDQLNNDGKKRLQAYAENLLNLQRADESVSTPSKVVDIPEHLISNAAHDSGATPEQKANADRIMMDDDEWK